MKHEPECQCKDCVMNREINRVMQEWGECGQIIEGGWQALLLGMPPETPELQLSEMRKAYYMGAQHLFASILMILEPGMEATDKDMQKLNLIHEELDRFVQALIKTN